MTTTHTYHETPWRDPETLRELYVDRALSQYRIAEILGCNQATISRWLRIHGIHTRSRGPYPGFDSRERHYTPWRDADKLRELYVDRDLSLRECADELGCSHYTVRYWLQKHDIEIAAPPGAASEDDA